MPFLTAENADYADGRGRVAFVGVHRSMPAYSAVPNLWLVISGKILISMNGAQVAKAPRKLPSRASGVPRGPSAFFI
jgi:hypothetical protein